MSDVWGELEERLKQKAKSIDDLHEIYHTDYLDSCLDDEPPWFWFWVRLEDVKAILKQLKQKYILVEKKKLEELITIYSNELPETVAIVSDLKAVSYTHLTLPTN